MAKLPLSENLKDALIHGKGDLNDYLKLAVCYEKGDWSEVSELKDTIGLDEEELPSYFMEALSWADTITTL